MSLADRQYLIIPEDYAASLDGLHWSAAGDAVEVGVGETFAFAPQIWQFLEGFVAVRAPLHFAHILQLLHLLGLGPISRVAEHGAELRRAFLLAGKPLRNAGFFCAHLCQDVPGTSLPVEAPGLKQALLDFDAWGGPPVELPALAPAAFQQHALQALEKFSPEEIVHWLKFGQALAVGASKRLAEELAWRPPNLAAALAAAARDCERLSGALALVPALNGALTIPPRRLDANELPVGGYADITTRGEPERLLPAQFALESAEFIRRFAEHELLFFRREEPTQPTREELVIVLDQGVRTWGGVRLALAGAVFAFAQFARRRGIPVRLATTGHKDGSVDPLLLDTSVLSEMLEASDLSAEPTEVLSTVLAESSDRLRDVVLLTHPRSLAGDGVAAACAKQRPGDRLFAVNVDSEGRGGMDQLSGGRPMSLARFRVDLAAAEQAPSRPALPVMDSNGWIGDVEPVPFPFWFGPIRTVRRMAFNRGGDWLLVATNHGLLHAMTTDGRRRELLPRGFVDGQVLRDVDAVVGTHDGFVVCGWMSRGRRGAHRQEPVAFHYNLQRRRVQAFLLPLQYRRGACWFSFPDLHCVGYRSGRDEWTVDLDTGGRTPGGASTEINARARLAAARMRDRAVPPPLVTRAADALNDDVWYLFNRATGWLEVGGVTPEWRPAEPTFDGRRALCNAHVSGVQLAGSTLAVLACLPELGHRLLIMRGPEPVVLREIPLPAACEFRLTADGQRVAVQTAVQQVQVFNTGDGSPGVSVMAPGRCHTNIDVGLGDDWLRVSVGRFHHLYRWSGAELEHRTGPALAPQELRQAPIAGAGQAPAESAPLTRYDAGRFQPRAIRQLRVETDRFGQLIILDRTGERLIAMLTVRRDKAAIWLPDGTRWGAAELGGPATPGAAGRIARALHKG